MSISGNWTATPNRVEMFIDFLKKNKKSYKKSDLQIMFTPQSNAPFIEIYAILNSLNLVKIENDIVKLNIINSKLSSFQIIKEAIFQNDFKNKDNFVIALSWFMIQKHTDLLPIDAEPITKIKKDLSNEHDSLDLGNTDNWRQFIYWCIYLGFATKVYISGKIFICPDPTEAIERELKRVFKESKELLIRDFFEYLAKVIPVLEFGSVRNKILDRAREGLQLSDNMLSFSTSLALLRLEKRGLISLEQKSDADSFSLESNSENSRIISHIVYRGKIK